MSDHSESVASVVIDPDVLVDAEWLDDASFVTETYRLAGDIHYERNGICIRCHRHTVEVYVGRWPSLALVGVNPTRRELAALVDAIAAIDRR